MFKKQLGGQKMYACVCSERDVNLYEYITVGEKVASHGLCDTMIKHMKGFYFTFQQACNFYPEI